MSRCKLHSFADEQRRHRVAFLAQKRARENFLCADVLPCSVGVKEDYEQATSLHERVRDNLYQAEASHLELE